MNEKLSAFMDNELSELEERQLLKEMAQNEQLRAAWERYHLVGGALRHEATSSVDVSKRVMQALDNEAPKAAAWRAVKVLSAAGIGKAIGGLAIAASVATVAIISVRPSLIPSETNVAAATPAPVTTAPVALASDKDKAAQQLATMDPLNSYLVEHNEYASPFRGIGGALPDVRTVDFDHNPSQ